MNSNKKTLVEFGNYLFSDERKELLEESGKELLEERFSKISDADVSNFLNKIPEQTTDLTFGQAVESLKLGKKVARIGWNGKQMFLFLVQGSTFKVNRPPLLGIYEEGTEINYCSHVDMRTADGSIVPWLASQTDILAEDWVILD